MFYSDYRLQVPWVSTSLSFFSFAVVSLIQKHVSFFTTHHSDLGSVQEVAGHMSCVVSVNIVAWSITVIQEGATCCLCSGLCDQRIRMSSWSLAALRLPDAQQHRWEQWASAEIWKGFSEFLLIVGLSDLVLLECTKHGRKYHSQRKCGFAVARSLSVEDHRKTCFVHSFHVSVWTMSDHEKKNPY